MSEVAQPPEPTAKEMTAARDALTAWQEPKEFIAKVAKLGALVRSVALFNKPSLGFLLDALILAEFVKLRTTEQVRLVEPREQWPDGKIGTRLKQTNVEITEVQEEGRKRGDEYREVGKAVPDPVEDWPAKAAAIPGQLETAIQKKIDKKYASKPILLIYLNMSDFGLLQKETEAAIAKLKAKYSAHFLEICVIWKAKLY